MRIIGGKDYYDGASAYGIDPAIVLVRDSRVLTNANMRDIGTPGIGNLSLSEPLRKDVDAWKNRDVPVVYLDGRYGQKPETLHGQNYRLQGHGVLFCGVQYPGLQIHSVEEHKDYWFWHWDKLERWAAERDLEAHATIYYWSKAQNPDPFTAYKLPEVNIQRLIDLNVSVAIKKGPTPPTNYKKRAEWLDLDSGWRADTTGLSDMGFQSAIDPVTAFQELSMWVGGTLGGAARGPAVEIQDDAVKLVKHGMDETSFRRPKAKYQ